jgi:hypothetical protein
MQGERYVTPYVSRRNRPFGTRHKCCVCPETVVSLRQGCRQEQCSITAFASSSSLVLAEWPVFLLTFRLPRTQGLHTLSSIITINVRNGTAQNLPKM